MKRLTMIVLLLLFSLAAFPAFAQAKDSDGDGLSDREDACPSQAGPRENKGCPVADLVVNPTTAPKDSDGDGLPDSDDQCPTDSGPRENRGCPARDTSSNPDTNMGDGTSGGSSDGSGTSNPDTDGDGTFDTDDLCATVWGPRENRGCPADAPTGIAEPGNQLPGLGSGTSNPDTDGDGTFDTDDLCATVWGPRENRGCPVETGIPEPTSVPAFVAPLLPTDGCYITTLNGININVRKAPAMGTDIIGYLRSGTVYSAEGFVTTESGVWFVVKTYEGSTGDVGYSSARVLLSSTCAETSAMKSANNLKQLGMALHNYDSICRAAGDHAVTVLAWARVDGVSPDGVSPDDVIVDGHVITAEDWNLSCVTGTGQIVPPNLPTGVIVGTDEPVNPLDLTIAAIPTSADPGKPSEMISYSFTQITFNHSQDGLELDLRGTELGGTQTHDDGSTTVEYCIYIELYEVGVFNKVCYQVEIPANCILTTSEAGVYTVVCEDGAGISLNPDLEDLPALEITTPPDTQDYILIELLPVKVTAAPPQPILIGLLLPAVQK